MKKIIPADVTLIPDNAQRVFTGKIFDVYQWQQKMFDGSTNTFEMLKRPDTVMVIGVVDDKILVIDDEQPHHGMKIGFPGGRVDSSDISTEAAARREVIEETGYHFGNFKLIDVVKPVHKMEWFIYAFVAWGIKKSVDQSLDSGEKIKVRLKTFDEVKAMTINKLGYLGETHHIFESCTSVDELLALPAFVGQEVDR